jgi:hypothetical protein
MEGRMERRRGSAHRGPSRDSAFPGERDQPGGSREACVGTARAPASAMGAALDELARVIGSGSARLFTGAGFSSGGPA